MKSNKTPVISVVVPVYNEGRGLTDLCHAIVRQLKSMPEDWEIIFVNDGSTDQTVEIVRQLRSQDARIKLISLSRNFGKENALSAGYAAAAGSAVLTLDGDGQHPVELIPQFLERWRSGARVVVGLRQNDSGDGFLKRTGSHMFYRLINKMTSQKLIAGSTDFRLIDASVQKEFLKLHETERINRGLIDWLGFQPEYIQFESKKRTTGDANYSSRMLVRLALNSIVSLTVLPLYIFGYLGIVITASSFVLGASIFVEQLVLDDPLNWNFTGTAMLGVMIIFLVGIVLMSQGVLSLYMSHIHSQSKNRPLFVVDEKNSDGIS